MPATTPETKLEPTRQQEEVREIRDEKRTCTRSMYNKAQGGTLRMKEGKERPWKDKIVNTTESHQKCKAEK